MGAGAILSIFKPNKFKHSSNPEIQKMRKDKWQYSYASKDQDVLHEDAFDLKITFHKEKFSESEELNTLKRARQPDGFKEAKKKAFKSFLKTRVVETLPDIQGDTFEVLYSKLETAWKSGIVYFFRDAVNETIKSQNLSMTAGINADIYYLNERWNMKVTLSAIQLEKKAEEDIKIYPLAGSMTFDFVLTEQYFQLQPSSYHTTNPLLEKLCFEKSVKITPALLAYQEKERAFEDAVTGFQNEIKTLMLLDVAKTAEERDKRLKPAQDVLNDLKAIKKAHRHDEASLEKLTTVVTVASNLLTNATHEAIKFNQLITEMQQRPWGETLAYSMTVFLGACLFSAGVTLLGVSLGSAALPASLLMVAGVGLVAGGCIGLFGKNKMSALKEDAGVYISALKEHEERKLII